jgi:hypothetical protein
VVNNGEEKIFCFQRKILQFKNQVTNHTSFTTDLQFANNFGKLAGEFSYRNLFENNRQLNLRFYAGTFVQ